MSALEGSGVEVEEGSSEVGASVVEEDAGLGRFSFGVMSFV